MSSPGAGQDHAAGARPARNWPARCPSRSIEGDQETALDASRILAAGSQVVQINTGVGCHLDAEMVAQGAARPRPAERLDRGDRERRQPGLPGAVRPGRAGQGRAGLGDRGRGQAAEVPAHVPPGRPGAAEQDRPAARTWTSTSASTPSGLRKVTPDALLLQLSATTGDGMQAWYDWLRRRAPAPHETQRPPGVPATAEQPGAAARRVASSRASRSRDAATTAWPRLIPPSLQGTRRCVSTRKPAACQPARRPGSAAAGSGTPRRTAPPCPGRSASRSVTQASSMSAGDAVVEPRRDDPGADRPRARSSAAAADQVGARARCAAPLARPGRRAAR